MIQFQNYKKEYYQYLLKQAIETQSIDLFNIIPKEYIPTIKMNEKDFESYIINNNLFSIKYIIFKSKNNFILNKVLVLASKHGNLDFVKYLVENGADISAKDNYSLRWATKNRYFYIIQHIM